MDGLDILNGVKETVNRHLSGERSFFYPKLLSEKYTPFNCDDTKFNITLSKIDENNTLLMTPMRNITRASQLNAQVNKHRLFKHDEYSCDTWLPSVLVKVQKWSV